MPCFYSQKERINIARFYGEVREGKVKFSNPQLVKQYVSTLDDGLSVEVTFKPTGEDITSEQWGYYFAAIVRRIAEHTGDPEQVVDGMICKCFLTMLKGTNKEYVRSKTDLNRKELSDFIEKAASIAAYLGVQIEPPNPRWKETKKKTKENKE